MTAFVTPLPKPQKRGPKAKKPIARTSRPARVRRTAAGRSKHAADLKWAKAVRESGPCAASDSCVSWLDGDGGHNTFMHIRCARKVTAAHIVSRRYRETRTDLENGLPLCLMVHRFFTEHPLAWDAFVIQRIGTERYEALKMKALGRAA